MRGGGTGLSGAHPLSVTDLIDIWGSSQLTCNFTATANCIANMAEGVYDVWATTDCYIADGANATVANGVLTNTGYLLRAGNTVPMFIRPLHFLGAIRASADGVLAAVKVG
jgi:hypothetical protein